MEGTPFGHYRLLALLGRGGMGEVWRAYDTDSDRIVAVKVLPEQFVHDKAFQQRFRREARAAAGLNEPHVVPIHRYGEIEGRLYVDMRLIEGRDLETLLADGPLQAALAVKITEQVASALHAAHRVGLVHRDVKPSNILIAEDDFAYLIDFGIARAAGQTALTNTGAAIGTWAYMAPERFTTGQADARADVYALTCVLHQSLTGQLPYPGDSLEQQVAGHLMTPPPQPSTVHHTVPAELDAVIATGMAKNPDDRYGTTKELAHAALAAITAPTAAPDPTMQAPQRTQPAPTQPSELLASLDNQLTPPGVAPLAPTQMRGLTDATRQRSPVGKELPDQKPSAPRNKRVLWGGIAAGIAVIAVVAVVLVMVNSDNGGGSQSAAPTPGAPPPNTGPFTGTFTADVGPQLRYSGAPREGAPPPYKETWRLRSVCRPSGCVAIAATGGQFPTKEVVFDDIGGRWFAVTVSQGLCHTYDTEQFHVISLQPRPDGTMNGEWTTTAAKGCFDKRTITFTRTGDTDVGLLADPANQPPRVVSPAQALHGRYHAETTFANGAREESDFGVRTDCLRTGERCLSDFLNPDTGTGAVLVFGNGKWTRTEEFDEPCSAGGTSHIKVSAEFPLPQPPQDPITLLTGHGQLEATGSACVDNDFDQKFIRTGD